MYATTAIVTPSGWFKAVRKNSEDLARLCDKFLGPAPHGASYEIWLWQRCDRQDWFSIDERLNAVFERAPENVVDLKLPGWKPLCDLLISRGVFRDF